MKSIRSVYKIGNGPSSSHTVGPYNAALWFIHNCKDADKYKVTLYGSLAFTGMGHGTSKAIQNVIKDVEIVFNTAETNLPHPNTMLFEGYKNNEIVFKKRIFSIGGGSIKIENEPEEDVDIYPQTSFSEIMDECIKNNESLIDFIYKIEGNDLKDYLRKIWGAMKSSIEAGLKADGILPGGLEVTRKARSLFEKNDKDESPDVKTNRLLAAYAFAVSEENASEHVVVTAPTCGSCGVIPAVMYYEEKDKGYSEDEIIDALAVAGLIGNVIRTNASISGAECGCQAEIGSACSMAAAGLAHLFGLSLDQIEYSAEVAMEHNLGLTCDPINGLVQIPCIERNSVAAMRALSCVTLSYFLTSTRKISFDQIIETMYQTGKDMDPKYKETSHGGLAAMYKQKKAN